MLTIEPTMDIIFEHVVHMFCLVSVLGATPNHIPLKHKSWIKISNQIRHVYLNHLDPKHRVCAQLVNEACLALR
jgi:hypothetical protein